jgi:hypothetical protein
MFGVARSIFSDNGSSLVSILTTQMTDMFKVKRIQTGAHSQWETGLVEQINKRIQMGFRAYLKDPRKWHEVIPIIEMALRTTPNDSTGISPHEVLFGYKPQNEVDWELSQKILDDDNANQRLKGMAKGLELLRSAVKENITESRDKNRRYYNKGRVEVKDFPLGSLVLMQNFRRHKDTPQKFRPAFVGPFIVRKRIGHALYRLQDAVTNKVLRYLVNQNHLKKYDSTASKEYLQEQLNDTMKQTDIQSDRRIARPEHIVDVQTLWKKVVKILDRKGNKYLVQMTDDTTQLVGPEAVPPAMKTDYNQQTHGRSRPVLDRKAKLNIRQI